MAMSQQEVIKKFMASLDKTTQSGTSAVNEALKVATNGKFKTFDALKTQLLKDRANSKNGDDFLKRYCGINLDNEDTGAITGSDAGGNTIKTSTSVIPNGTFNTSLNQNKFTKRGVTFELLLEKGGYLYNVPNLDDFTSEEKHIWQGLYSFWAEEALKLIEESYGYSFRDSDAITKKINFYFIDVENGATGESQGITTSYDGKETYISMYINMYYFKHIAQDDPDGKYPYWSNYYLDRLFAHELTHAIMTAKVDNFMKLPGFIIEGTAELTGGVDDSERPFIENAVSSKDMLAKYLDDKSDNLTNEDYVGGYIFLRYLARQFGDLNISNSTSNTLVSGFYGNDSIYNSSGANYVTIEGGEGKDTLYNFEGNYACMIGGQGDDSIYNKSWYSTIDGGKGNDIIINRDVGYKTSINGGDGNDIVSLSGTNFGGITINGGTGNDKIYAESLASGNYGILYQYNSGDGNDTIYGLNSDDTLQISGAKYSTVKSGNDIKISVGSGSILAKNTSKIDFKIVGTLEGGSNTLPAGISVKNSVVTASTLFSGSKIDLSDYSGATKVNAAALSKNVSIVGTAAANSLKGGKGNDTIFGGAGNDTVSLGGGNDIYIYSSGNDYIQDYTAGKDKIKLSSGSISSASLSSSNVILNITTGGKITVKGGKNKNITVIDGNNKETTNIYPISNLPAGISVKNSIVTAAKTFTGNKIDLSDYPTATKVNAAAISKNVSIIGTAANNTLTGGKVADTINGGAENDVIIGSNGNDWLYGDDDNDRLSGGDGHDLLIGDAGDDSLNGGNGNDLLVGGLGKNTLTGGAGNDTFYISVGQNYITDYKAGEDKLNILSASVTSYSFNNKDLTLKLSTGSITTIKGGKGKKITFIDLNNNTITKTYSKTFDLLYDNNFMTDDTKLDSITEQKFEVQNIQTQNYSNLENEETILTYSKDK